MGSTPTQSFAYDRKCPLLHVYETLNAIYARSSVIMGVLPSGKRKPFAAVSNLNQRYFVSDVTDAASVSNNRRAAARPSRRVRHKYGNATIIEVCVTVYYFPTVRHIRQRSMTWF